MTMLREKHRVFLFYNFHWRSINIAFINDMSFQARYLVSTGKFTEGERNKQVNVLTITKGKVCQQ